MSGRPTDGGSCTGQRTRLVVVDRAGKTKVNKVEAAEQLKG
jgi:hypothetical protein